MKKIKSVLITYEDNTKEFVTDCKQYSLFNFLKKILLQFKRNGN